MYILSFSYIYIFQQIIQPSIPNHPTNQLIIRFKMTSSLYIWDKKCYLIFGGRSPTDQGRGPVLQAGAILESALFSVVFHSDPTWAISSGDFRGKVAEPAISFLTDIETRNHERGGSKSLHGQQWTEKSNEPWKIYFDFFFMANENLVLDYSGRFPRRS